MKGFIHSTDSFGTVDGPGIRFVVFTQGCPLRCKYCHNPDTWKPGIGNQMTTDQILEKYDSCKAFLKDGGITVTGGEPLLQIDFLIELFTKCKRKNIHTCLDTSGITFSRDKIDIFQKLMDVTDLVMLDIKHIDNEQHKELTGLENKAILDFAKYLFEINKTVWIRHVVVPGITLNDEYLDKLGYFLGDLKNIKALDVLPYHAMGNSKYKALGIKAPLEAVPEATKDEATHARDIILNGMKRRLKEKL